MSILESFKQYATDYEKQNSLLEEVYKIARDITSNSKKVIGALQRTKIGPTYHKNLDDAFALLKQVNTKYIFDLYCKLSIDGPLSHYWICYQKFCFSLEEYIEACSFYYFLKYGELVSLDWVNTTLQTHITEKLKDTSLEQFKHKESLVPPTIIQTREFLLGILDLPGELMRFATVNASQSTNGTPLANINNIYLDQNSDLEPAKKFKPNNESCETGEVDMLLDGGVATAICRFVSLLSAQLQYLVETHQYSLRIRDADRKNSIMLDSVKKLEKLGYNWQTKKEEYGDQIGLVLSKLRDTSVPEQTDS